MKSHLHRTHASRPHLRRVRLKRIPAFHPDAAATGSFAVFFAILPATLYFLVGDRFIFALPRQR